MNRGVWVDTDLTLRMPAKANVPNGGHLPKGFDELGAVVGVCKVLFRHKRGFAVTLENTFSAVANSLLISPEWDSNKLRPSDGAYDLTVVHWQGISKRHDVEDVFLALLPLAIKHLVNLRADGSLSRGVWQVRRSDHPRRVRTIFKDMPRRYRSHGARVDDISNFLVTLEFIGTIETDAFERRVLLRAVVSPFPPLEAYAIDLNVLAT